ncbi:hypothetical protein GCM10023324_18790 [Streptomyces youssoufiensis]
MRHQLGSQGGLLGQKGALVRPVRRRRSGGSWCVTPGAWARPVPAGAGVPPGGARPVVCAAADAIPLSPNSSQMQSIVGQSSRGYRAPKGVRCEAAGPKWR